jgi:hypothetical protein
MRTAMPIVFDGAFTTSTAANVNNVATIQGPTGHAAAPAVFRFAHQAAAAATTDALRARPAMILPPEIVADAISGAPLDGCYTLLGFYNQFLARPMAGTAAEQATYTPLCEWWRVACTDAAGGAPILAVTPLAPANLRETARLSTWANQVRELAMARVGAGGPGLTSAAFAQGINNITTQLTTNHTAALTYDREKNNKTFTDVHGDALAQQLRRLCNVANDALLPEVHLLLLKTPKAQVYGALEGVFAE